MPLQAHPRFSRRLLLLYCVLLTVAGRGEAASLSGADKGQTPAERKTFHSETNWEVRPSLKYDTLCLLNVLSGDPYYLKYYRAEYEHFHPLFTPQENAAFTNLKAIIKDEGGGIVSAKLALYYSAVDDETLPQMVRTARDSRKMKAALQQTPYWSEDGWQQYERVRPSLEAALRALGRVKFPRYWAQSAEPHIEHRIAELTPDLPKYNIVPAIEKYLGFPLPSNTITVYVLQYSEPHGIRITGLRFLTHESYPFRIVLRNAIHESMHPPYNPRDPQVERALALLSSDPLVTDKVAHHDASFGYNTAAGYIEEDSVQALEQLLNEQFGVARDARTYWIEQDGGMHVLAAAIYTDYKAALQTAPQSYSHWFVQAVQDGQLRGEPLQNTVREFFSAGGESNR